MPNQSADPMRVGGENTSLLRRRLIFADPERSIVRISRDGTRIAFRAPVDGVLNLWVAPLDRIDEARPVTAVTDRNLGPWILWMHDNRHVVFFREAAGDENWRAWRVDLETGDVRPLTPGPGVTCRIQQMSRHFPSELLIMHNTRDKRYFDIYRVNVATGESALLHLNQSVPGHFTDQQFRVRFAVRYTEHGDVEYLRLGSDGERSLFSRIGAEDAMATRAIEFSADGNELYWLDSRGRDTAAVVAQDVASGAMRVLAEDPRADFTELLLDPISERPVAAARSFERVAWQVLDPDYQSDFDYLTRQSRGDLTVTGMSQDRRQWIRLSIRRRAHGMVPLRPRSAAGAAAVFVDAGMGGATLRAHEAHHHPRPRRPRTRLLPVPSARRTAEGAITDGVARPRRALGARHMGSVCQSPVARQPGLCGAECELSRFDRVRQSFCQCRQPRMGGQDA